MVVGETQAKPRVFPFVPFVLVSRSCGEVLSIKVVSRTEWRETEQIGSTLPGVRKGSEATGRRLVRRWSDDRDNCPK